MRRLFIMGAAFFLATRVAAGLMIAPPAIPMRVAQADCIVYGKVTAIENKTELARAFVGAKEKQAYKVAVINITQGLFGVKGVTSVRVGFVPPQPIQGGGRGGPIRIRRFPQVDLKPGQEGIFILTQHWDGNFLTAMNYYDVIYKHANIKTELEQIKKSVGLLANPKKGLKSKSAEDRLMTAGLLLGRYRAVRQGMKFPYKTVAIDADESKLILTAIAEADFTKPRRFGDISPQQMFYQLGLTAKDGWNPPPFRQPNDFAQAVKKWLKDNQGKYRIHRYVSENREKNGKINKN